MAGTRTRDSNETGSQSPPNAYTGMLIISLIATVTGLLFLWLDYGSYPDKQAPKSTLSPPKLAAPAPAPEAQPR